MKLFLYLLLCSCAFASHAEKVAGWRAKLPTTSTVRSSESMAGFKKGDKLEVAAMDFAKIKPGTKVFIWPAWSEIPLFHEAKFWKGTPNHKVWVCAGDTKQTSIDDITEETFIGVWRAAK